MKFIPAKYARSSTTANSFMYAKKFKSLLFISYILL